MEIAGKKVVDARKRIILHITKGDVERGNTKDPAACAAALACMRQFHTTQARVHLARTYILRGETWWRHRTCGPLRSELIAFDRGGAFAPGDYELGACQPSVHFGVKRKNYPKTNKHPQKGNRRKVYHVVSGVREKGANR